jgi:rubredoxin
VAQPIPAPEPVPLPVPTAPPPAKVHVAAVPGSELEQHLAQRDMAIAAVKEAQSRLEAINDGIKALLTGAHQGVPSIGIAAGPRWPELSLTWVTPKRFDRKQFARDHADLDAEYTVWGTPHWRLAEAGGGK